MGNELFSLELFIAKLLRYGVVLAGAFLLLGWLTQISFAGNPFLSFAHFHSLPLRESLNAAVMEHRWGLISSYIGLFILVALPFTRVLMTVFLFYKQKEFYLALTGIFVTVALIVSFSLGFEI